MIRHPDNLCFLVDQFVVGLHFEGLFRNPNPPAPKIATDSPAAIRAFFNPCNEVADEHIMIAPCSNGISGGNENTLRSGITSNSANPPSRCLPIISAFAQNCSVPSRQYR